MATLPEPTDTQRHVGPLLATAIFAVPLVFYWLPLRRGHANSTRRAALAYLIGTMGPGIVAVLFGF